MDALMTWSAVLALQALLFPFGAVFGEAVQVTTGNFEELKRSKDIIMLNFYADWCRFSQMLKPIYDKAADKLGENDRVLLGKVNCDTDKDLCTNPFHVTKYPTIKIIRYGMVARREYRGQRTADAIVGYVEEQLKDPVQAIQGLEELASKDKRLAMIGYFASNTSAGYLNYMRVAISLKDDCPFYGYFGDASRAPQIVFREEGKSDSIYTGSIDDLTAMFTWVYEHCVPLVREITFQNGEEMTEEGLPLLILFYSPEDKSTKELFKQRVEADLKDLRGTVNCVTADGVMFAHPLHHLGKHKNDLPVLAIDSFRHMYVFPNFEDIKVPGKIYDFIKDLHSGKLHKDFHNPPPPTQDNIAAPTRGEVKRSAPQSPPESTFKKLAPARSRYSFRDEL